jgi:hypothetical protein
MVAFQSALLVGLANCFTVVSAAYNIGGCIGALEGGGIMAAGTCAAAELTADLLVPVDIACIASIAVDIASSVGACSSCAVAGACDPTDQVAAQRGCSQLGPNHCLQLSNSVPQPSYTDKRLGSYAFHCHNKGLVSDSTGVTSTYPCTNCTECADVPGSKRQLEEVIFTGSAISQWWIEAISQISGVLHTLFKLGVQFGGYVSA